ncbi:MAG: HNH endonuclease [Acidimicrobiales bacterium]|nr:HNH endonuclease [Acidimicrobiales bacterium]MCB1259157.1 HNH endonuclease [Acidimicrobiales bacterium]
MNRALVLNASFEPLGVVSGRRAVVLVLGDKAEVVHETGLVLHSERATVALPSVIRLRHYVRVPHQRRAALNRRAVFLRDGGRCQYCGRRAESIDHVVPRSRGGAHSWDNVVAACRRCNSAKRDRLLEETTMRLPRRPQAPRPGTWIAFALNEVPAAWQDYVGSPDPAGPSGLVAASA